MSVALEVCRIVEDRIGLDTLTRVREVGVVVGRRSGVEPDNLRFCLEALLEREPFDGARPILELTPGDDLAVSYLEIEDGDPTN